MATQRRRRTSTKTADKKKKTTKKEQKRPEQKIYNQSAISGDYESAPSAPPTYHEIIIKNIVSNSKGRNVPDEAMLLSATLSSLSGDMREMQYRAGIPVGKSLYKTNNENRKYTFMEESVADLVKFFESVGYKSVTYRAFPGNVSISIHGKHDTNVGANVHSFEAGIIAGYMNAAERKFVDVTESSCLNNDGHSCTFNIKYTSSPARETGPDNRSIDRLVNHITEKVKEPNASAHGPHISNAYYSLHSSLLTDRSYNEPMKSIAAYVGKGVGDRLFENKRSGRAFFSYLENTLRLLNLGTATIKSTKPLQMQVQFDSLTSKKEFVDLSLAFINGLISDRFGKDLVASERSNSTGYVLDIREAK